MPAETTVIPWIELSDDISVTVNFTGLGKLNCPERYVTPPPIPPPPTIYDCLNSTWTGPYEV